MSALSSTPSTMNTGCSARSTKAASIGAKKLPTSWIPRIGKGYLNRLAEAGINVLEIMDTGQLELLPWTDMYVRDHRFDQDAMLATVEKLIQSGAAAGYARTKLVGHHMDWLFFDKPAVKNLLEYEARLNNVLSKYDAPVIWNYDLSKFGASLAMDIMRTHPLAIIGGLLRENPFFVPPDQFLNEMRERRSARKTAS
jgi:DcmR-like sensory protein